MPALFLFGLFALAPGSTTAAEENGSASDGVYALGRIEPEHGILHIGSSSMVNAVSGAVVRKLLVEAGTRVKAGDLLGDTDTTAVEDGMVAIARAEVELAVHEAEMAKGEEQDACSRADVAQRTAARRSRLLKSGVASDEEADVAVGDARALSGSCAAARLATRAAAAKVDVARAHVQRAEAERARCDIRAPIDGTVLKVLKRPGEMLGIDGLVLMGNLDRMYAITEVYETDIGRVRKGQKATVTSPALQEALSGVVERIRMQVRKQDATGTDPAARKDARIVEVEVLLDKPEPVATLSNLQVDVRLHP